MHMPTAGGFKYLVQGRCLVLHYPEFQMLQYETSSALANWIFEDILCQWGTLVEIVSDNRPAFIKALDQLAKKYHVWHIRILGYNSCTNGIAERPHFDVRQALFKAIDGDQAKWNPTGTHPLLPLDITEATYLLPLPTTILRTTNLIAQWAIALQKH
ncbi:hypothetical protein HETIRDRAFT_104227 [Heterobasidion irregulare TC 32-1]|uniref:Integrase catalytic domain-containing protein n=1 Tax=Heterobasidion irregulare (strain TC 32-1) TaxID=747525 RepID=W4K1D4_HETIT|nr:uncharacterized protein HETIRDRAFT_104227 [Heterobasidion irregulare TC 32-1]ETW78891.1 hypothetical protein HETIRDRAFT_104227 [Heterobasidion irregulare TC 32-1]